MIKKITNNQPLKNRERKKTIQEQEGSRTRFPFSIKMGWFFESKNDKKYQGILSTKSDQFKGNWYILNSKGRDASRCHVDSKGSISYRIDKKGNIYYRTGLSIYKMEWRMDSLS